MTSFGSDSTTGDGVCYSFSFLVEDVKVGAIVDFGANEVELGSGGGRVELGLMRSVGG